MFHFDIPDVMLTSGLAEKLQRPHGGNVGVCDPVYIFIQFKDIVITVYVCVWT